MLTLFTLICLHTKQISSWHEERRSKKEEPFITLSSEFMKERATTSAELNPQNPSAFEENPSPTASQTNLSTSTPVLETHAIFWCVHMPTASLEYSFNQPLTSQPINWYGTLSSRATNHHTQAFMEAHLNDQFIFFTLHKSCSYSVWSEINKLKTLEVSQDQHLAKTWLKVSSQMLVCKGEDFAQISSPLQSVPMESSYIKQQVHIFQSRLKITLVSNWKLRNLFWLGCRAL